MRAEQRAARSRAEPRVVRDVRWGIGWGLAFAVGFSLIALVSFAFGDPRQFAEMGLAPATTLGAYAFGGVVGGTLVGLLRPLTRWRAGAGLVGIVACLPLSLGFLVAMHGTPSQWTRTQVTAGLLTALLLGTACGTLWWEEPPTTEQPRKARR
jgi:MFS family permease